MSQEDQKLQPENEDQVDSEESDLQQHERKRRGRDRLAYGMLINPDDRFPFYMSASAPICDPAFALPGIVEEYKAFQQEFDPIWNEIGVQLVTARLTKLIKEGHSPQRAAVLVQTDLQSRFTSAMSTWVKDLQDNRKELWEEMVYRLTMWWKMVCHDLDYTQKKIAVLEDHFRSLLTDPDHAQQPRYHSRDLHWRASKFTRGYQTAPLDTVRANHLAMVHDFTRNLEVTALQD
jgi:hypothetical protein